jgi:hypothetical protein|tara:strand:- start:224 stop:469 length:246 start_codon:yes stop_codon:yes gene_type:complete
MVKKKTRKSRTKLSTKFKRDPIGTARREFKKLHPVSKAAVIGVAAGALTPQAAQEINKLPFVGKFMKIFTGYGATLKRKMK